MKFFNTLAARFTSLRRNSRRSHQPIAVESMEQRMLLTGNTQAVLMVIADRQNFDYQEYGDTRAALEKAGLKVAVAATTVSPSKALPNTGQGNSRGVVMPDLALAAARGDDYSAIVFVGGWGSSMYQYDFPGTYSNHRYNGDLVTKQVVNDLINDFVEQDKYVTAICHGTTVLAWARVDGVSPLSGKQVSVPHVGSPAVVYNGEHYRNYELGQYEQIVANGGRANTTSGQYGDPATATDDVVVDGRIITAENWRSARVFGWTIAQRVIGAGTANNAPVNHEPAFVPARGNDLLVQKSSAVDTNENWCGYSAADVFTSTHWVQSGAMQLPAGSHTIVRNSVVQERTPGNGTRIPLSSTGAAGPVLSDALYGDSENLLALLS